MTDSARLILPALANPQQGAALVTSLVILLVLTIIGMASLTTTNQQQKMAIGVQESQRAFQAAESGLTRVFNTTSGFSLSSSPPQNFDFGAYSKAEVVTQFEGWSMPPRGSGYSATGPIGAAHFNSTSKGKGATTTGAEAIVHQGAYQITPK
ncbi:MAG: hypothetical protein GXP09_07680 [Gammaproteobacteria bacterium]|nr:hypothetical protein [Gammaproteobacteria bacterium]